RAERRWKPRFTDPPREDLWRSARSWGNLPVSPDPHPLVRFADGRFAPASCLWRRALLCGYGFGLSLQLVDDAARLRGIDVNSWPHRTRERDLPDVAALRRGGLRAHDLVDERRVVLNQLPLLKALLADRHVDVRAAVGA